MLKNNLVILNNELGVNNHKDKKMRTDILIEVEKTIINLEMNKYYYDGLFQKNNAYHNKLVAEQFDESQDYNQVKKVIQICFDDFNRFDDRIVIKFVMADLKRGLLEDKNVEKYHIILPNIKNKCYNNTELSRFEKELLLLIENNLDKLKSLVGDDKGLMKAVEKREKLSQDKKIIGLYDAEKMERYDRNCRLAYAEKIGIERGMAKGMKKGIEQGIEQGIVQGIVQGAINKQQEIAKSMLKDNFPIDTVMKYTGLSQEEIENL